MKHPSVETFAKILHEKRKKERINFFYESKKMMRERNYYASAMVETGMADVMISGITEVIGSLFDQH